MKNILLKVLFLSLVSLTPLFTQNILACSCYGTSTPYEALKEAKTVFVGKVIAVKDVTGNEIIDEKITDYKEFLRKNEGTTRYYRFEVQELFKGAKVSELTVSSDINMCQFGFEVGESHLVYSYETSGVFRTDLFCSRTEGIKTAQDDVHFLRELLKNKPEPRIYGSVRFDDKDPVTGNFPYTFLEGIKIVAKSKNKRFETVTDKNGLYRFYKIPNGKYKIYPKLPSKYVNDYPDLQEVTLQTKDEPMYEGYFKFRRKSAYSRFRVRWNNKN